uniref:PA domain-containing protein n=1 Tax=Macrostomum lignano TaxID=282301 RepID=A0A1I8JMH6_9PLAT
MLFAVTGFLIVAVTSVLSDQLEVHLTDHKTNVTDTKFCSAETASFGSSYLFWSMQGIVVNTSPMNACHSVQPPPHLRNDSLAWIALVTRDSSLSTGCPFDVKVLNAQTAGYNAVLVQNYKDNLIIMQSSRFGSRVHIPAAMVTLACGTVLGERFSYSVAAERYSLNFEVPFPFDFHVYVISFAVIIGVCLLLSLLVWGIKFYRDWRHSRRNRLPRSSLKKLTAKTCTTAAPSASKTSCPARSFGFCLAITLPHQMRGPVAAESRSTCPVCKRRVFPGSADSEGEDDDREGPGLANDGAGPSSGRRVSAVGAAPAAFPSQSSSTSLLTAMQDERTPLLNRSSWRSQRTLLDPADSAPAPPDSGDGRVGTFDNAALDSDNQLDAADETAASSSSVSVRVVVHSGGPPPAEELRQPELSSCRSRT